MIMMEFTEVHQERMLKQTAQIINIKTISDRYKTIISQLKSSQMLTTTEIMP